MSRRTVPSPLPIIRRCLAAEGVGNASVEATRSGSGYAVEIDYPATEESAVDRGLANAEREYARAATSKGRRW